MSSQHPFPKEIKRVAVRVTTPAETHIRRRHPWLYSDSITSTKSDPQTGDLAIIYDHNNKFLAIGLYDADSPIRVKLLHHGKPTPVDTSFFETTALTAFQKRTSLRPNTTAYRLINGEADGFPGLILDCYAKHHVLKLYTPAWIPYLETITSIIKHHLAPQALVLRLSRRLQDLKTSFSDGQILLGTSVSEPIEVTFLENNLRFVANLIKGQKTGHFLDQRDNRQLVRTFSKGKSVLDIFASTGGFSVYAAAGGARSITAIDISPHALTTAQRNLALNNLSSPFTPVTQDAFKALESLTEKYDIVIIDPPAFAQKQSDIPQALNAYKKLTRLGLDRLKKGGTLVQASCSSRIDADTFFETVGSAAQHHGRPLRNITHTHHALDHPTIDTFPEGSYLKCLFATS